jgi:AraC-like DNA-binding protein
MKHPYHYTVRDTKPLSPSFHSHPEFEIYYFHEGECTYLIGDQIHVLKPGDLIVMHGMTLHRPQTAPGRPYVRTVIHFDPAFFRPMLEHLKAAYVLQPFETLRNHRVSLDSAQQEQMDRLLTRLASRKHDSSPLGETKAMLDLLELMVFVYDCFRRPLKDKAEFPSSREERVQQVVRFIENHYMNDLHLNDLESQMHISRFYLAKLFKEVTGVTIFEYLYQRRINQAKILFLLDPDRSVTDICFEVGFKHPAHFSRTFKAKVGLTPEQYRRHAKLASAPPG